jgi:hypothetical protein
MDNQVFRQKSVERISSPEQLQDYMRVTTPGTWMVLAAVILLLAGLIICSIAGKIETKLSVQCEADEGVVNIELLPAQGEKVKAGMPLRIAGQEVPIDYVYQSEDRKTVVTAKAELEDGKYDGEIVTESISPISFLLNE